MAVETPEREEGTGIPDGPEAPPADRPAPAVPVWAPAAVIAALAGLWLLLRPASPSGAAAVADLLVLPALLALAIRLLAGRPALATGRLVTYFGLGAVGATASVLMVERLLRLVGTGTVNTIGPVLEVMAVCGPAVALALRPGDRPVRAADCALAGFATGLGFLVMNSSLAAAARHVAPHYFTPLVAGLYRVPASAGEPSVYFAGLPLAGAFVGLAAGMARRWGTVVVACAAGAATALAAFDDGVFQWRLRAINTSRPALASGPVALVSRLTLRGWLVPLLLVAGLAALQVRSRRAPPPAEAVTAPAVDPPGPAIDLRRVVPVTLAAAVVGAVVVLLARSRSLDFLGRRPVALLVALVGMAWSGLSLATASDRSGRDDDSDALLCAAAFACASAGVLWGLLPTTVATRPFDGGLLVDTALGWSILIGNLGVVLGLGGFAAPPGRVRLGAITVFGPDWRHRLRGGGGGGLRGLRGRGRLAGGSARSTAGRTTTTPWWRLEVGGRRRRRRDLAAGVRERSVAHTRLVTVAIEPAKARAIGQLDFTGATVKDAMAAALAQVGDLAHSSLQLVDEGSAGGKGGPARPARVRVVETADDEEPLLPPARDSVIRRGSLAVVVEIVADDDVERPDTVEVELRGGGRATTLRCTFDESVAGRDRYRSNHYSVTRGEDAIAGEERPAASPLRIANGGPLEAEYRKEKAVVAVYDTWAHQVLGVNQNLFEVTKDNHRTVVDELEELAALEEVGHADARLGHRIQQLRTRLGYVDEGLRMLAQDGDADAKAFRTTAVLATAMSLDDRFDERRNADALLESASVALAEHRRAVTADPDADVATGPFRVFLAGTAVGRLWHDGAWSPADVSRLLGWFRLSDVSDDLSERHRQRP